MNGLRGGAIPLFKLSGINVSLHWAWILVAVFEIGSRAGRYSSVAWNVAEYLSLFVIVLCHEFGHALACRSVGGTANQILLWPLGGVAYVNPPPRPGATLWSIAAGPLVNVAFLPIFTGLYFLGKAAGWAQTIPDLHTFIIAVWWTNVGLLVFNLLPVYPLDGGQILRSLLWFAIGRARSLMAAAIIGIIGAAGFVYLAFRIQDSWLAIIAVFLALNCWQGFQSARALSKLAALPRHGGFACPSCNAAPPMGTYWRCSQCGAQFDTFQSQAICPNCSKHFALTACMDCGRAFPLNHWASAGSIAAQPEPIAR